MSPDGGLGSEEGFETRIPEVRSLEEAAALPDEVIDEVVQAALKSSGIIED